MWETIFPDFIRVPKITNSVIKITIVPLRGISKYFFLGQKWYFLDTDSILRVKPMYDVLCVKVQTFGICSSGVDSGFEGSKKR